LCERVRRNGRKISLASSAKKEELDEYKKIAQVEDLIDAETSSADVDRSKPHPDIFDTALKNSVGSIATRSL
jgi:beta-phosphoglucomutase-like phosphatase (HAD superfamily)